MSERKYMELAIELAKKGCGFVAPNPMVGAVIVKDEKVIGEGYHHKYGSLHAERDALKNCVQDTKGAKMYVTLEPCCHQGKQPPCVEAIVEAKIRKVVIGSKDPKPLLSGKGIIYLKEHGIEVETDFLKEECDKVNDVFFYYIQTKLPYVVMKYAMTMDGKIATNTGDSKWITGEAARNQVHKDRHRYTGIMTGIGTVLADNPLLTCRIEGGKNPIRIICDTSLRTPLDSKIVCTADRISTIIATCEENPERIAEYKKRGCEILTLPQKDNHIDLRKLMEKLGEKKIDSILMECGSTLNWSAMASGIVKKVQTYVASKIVGGADAKSPIEGKGISELSQAFHLKNSIVRSFGMDFLIESEVEQNVYRDN